MTHSGLDLIFEISSQLGCVNLKGSFDVRIELIFNSGQETCGLGFKGQMNKITIATALNRIEELSNHSLQSTGAWTPYQIFTHCAQSVECSRLGYPKQRPEIFQKTIGKLAFSLFAATGRMIHPLDEPLPGAPPLEKKDNLEEALARLKKAYTDFEQYEGPLAPHFTYGVLTKEEYTLAHVMHLNNHLEEVQKL